MPEINFAEISADWPNELNDMLSQDAVGERFTGELVRRWAKNSPRAHYGLLAPSGHEHTNIPWSIAFGVALSSPLLVKESKAALITAFERAIGEFQPQITKGSVWLTDVMSLRHLRYSKENAELSQLATRMILQSAETLVDVTPARDFANYAKFFGVYNLLTYSLITELRDPEIVLRDYVVGKRLVPPTSPSLLKELWRLADSFAELDLTGEYEGRRLEELLEWNRLSAHYSQVVDSLFGTLNLINKDFCGKYANRWRRDLVRFSPGAVYSYARELDLPWFRLARAASDRDLGEAVIHYIREVRSGEIALKTIDEIGPVAGILNPSVGPYITFQVEPEAGIVVASNDVGRIIPAFLEKAEIQISAATGD